MSLLYDSSSLLLDFNNVLVNTDFFVCHTLYTTIKDRDFISKQPIHTFFDIIDQTGVDMIDNFVQVKTNINPFRDIIDVSLIEFESGIDKDVQINLMCDSLYKNILAKACQTDIPLLFTNIADSFKFLTKDTNLTNIYLYMDLDILSEPLHKAIFDYFDTNNTKVTIVGGDKKKFISENECNLYIFENARDIECLPSILDPNNIPKKEILLLDNDYNRTLWNTYFMDGDNTHTSVNTRFNIDVSFVKVQSNKLNSV